MDAVQWGGVERGGVEGEWWGGGREKDKRKEEGVGGRVGERAGGRVKARVRKQLVTEN